MTHINPIFLLKNIDPNDIYTKYKAGYFNTSIRTDLPKITIIKNEIKISPINSNVVTIVSAENNKLIMSGSTNVEIFMKNGCKPLCGGICDYCKIVFTQEREGYPLSYKVKSKMQEDGTYKIYHIFWIEGCTCRLECAYGEFIKLKNSIIKDPLMTDTEVLLKTMYKLKYTTDESLLPPKDPRLLIHNGGPLSYDEWCNQKAIYTRTNSIIKIPAQVIYTKQNI